jgi:hypothetical protein
VIGLGMRWTRGGRGGRGRSSVRSLHEFEIQRR